MPQPTTRILLPQPCAESWDAMTPASGGRHCAACQKTVVDFTLKTDAEILAFFAQASNGTCGRFLRSQLQRPLRPAAPVSPAPRWRGWLAAGLALWSLRAEATSSVSASLPPSAQHPRRQPAPLPTRQVAGRVISGVVCNADGQPLAQAEVWLRGSRRVATTNANGSFRLWVPARRGPHRPLVLVVQQLGFVTELVRVPLDPQAARGLKISLVAKEAPDLDLLMGGVALTSGTPALEEFTETPPPAQHPHASPSDAPKQLFSSPTIWSQHLT